MDLGTLNLYYIPDNGGYFYGKLNGAKVPSLWSEVGNILAAQYNATNADSIVATGATPFNMSMGIAPNGNIYFVNTSYTDAASFKAAMQGVILYYELAEPIVTEIEDDFNLDYEVWNGGTEKIVSDVPTTPLKADIAYGFNAVGKIKELEEKINSGGNGVSKEYVDGKLTELSAEVGKKQDTITDLATIREGAAKGATAIQEVKTINGQSIVGSGNIEIQGGGGGGGASSDKQGVVSQTLNYNSADNTYSVSNVVRGSIPSFFIDLVTEAGASFNAESGYFSLNGIDNIAYDEMRQIYDCRTGYGTNSLLAVYGNTYTARTNFAAFRGASTSFANHEPTTIYTRYLGYKNASITKFALSDSAIEVKSGSANNFDSFGISGAPMVRSRLEEIIGIICVSNLANSANFFYSGVYHPWLTTFYLKSLKASIDLSGMPRLSEATILYMINNEKAASAITIKLHADAKAMADASEAIQSALAAHTNITLGV